MIEQGPVAIVRLNDPRSTVFSRSTRENGPIPRRSDPREPSLFYSFELISLDYSTAYPGQCSDTRCDEFLRWSFSTLEITAGY